MDRLQPSSIASTQLQKFTFAKLYPRGGFRQKAGKTSKDGNSGGLPTVLQIHNRRITVKFVAADVSRR